MTPGRWGGLTRPQRLPVPCARGFHAASRMSEGRLRSVSRTGGKPPLIQRYRIWLLLSHNPCSGQIEGPAMRRRDFIILLAGPMGGWTSAVRAQQKTTPVIGYLSGASLGPWAPLIAA